MKTFIKCSRQARHLVKKKFRKVITVELIWLHLSEEGKTDLTYKDFNQYETNNLYNLL